jgi:hypothetical protein
MILKTPYEWCSEANVRILVLNEWPLEWFGSKEKHFFEFPRMPKNEFLEALSKCKVKPNSQPRKTEMYLEYRMYGLVAYQLCGTIHAGIQFGHAVVEFGQNVKGAGSIEKIYDKWAQKDKTFIILNGGTTNNSETCAGTLNKHLKSFYDAGILVATFYEPDLGNQLTAFVFLVDERVFNKTIYPDFVPETLPYSRRKPSEKQLEELENRNSQNYKHWLDKIGGEKNAFLREYLKPFRLA